MTTPSKPASVRSGVGPMTRDEIKREAVKLAAELGMDDEPGMVAYLRVTVARIHAAGLAQGRAEGLEQAATYLVAVADDPVYDPADDRLDGLDVDGVLRMMAAEIRALPTDTTAREAERSEQ